MADAAKLFAAELMPKSAPFAQWVEALPADARKLFMDHAGDPNLSTIGMWRIVKALEGRASKETVEQWRRGHGLQRG